MSAEQRFMTIRQMAKAGYDTEFHMRIPFRSCLWCFALAGLLQLAGAVPS